ncbi:hypothetical protein [Novosphingobium mangrovi (ex Huang et al. 2023)]|uniref:SMP-30/Gluconolactonase/LRE-like region domain-containing protein n=1 Tax=Novosphingobium mangrovi (ex Huang et al. 2023) TaxID=2976432 RepID=A0ABT2I0L9_9SPHN|nr:hypothetical protein [Novosphingobium mangrovi (ex Huang et al. 2023)]MCT2398348.1 hypothetical protein [Novosphingobium mangrovi (ex Huang et al. 2023)]
MASKRFEAPRGGEGARGWVRAIPALVAAVLAAAPVAAQDPQPAPVVHQIAAPEARQGVASDGTHVYAIDNTAIARYRIADGRKVAEWHGDPARYPHINSCTIAQAELVCAASNYPGVPQLSTIEIFAPETLHHLRSVSLGMMPGSLTVLDRHDGHWWAVLANYDGKGGEPGRDHRYTLFARLDEEFRIVRGWAFPDDVLARFAPRSASGASWGADGHLYVSGHDLPELYVLDLPDAGSVLVHKATIPVVTHGQAIDFDPREPALLWSIDRASNTVVASRISVAP